MYQNVETFIFIFLPDLLHYHFNLLSLEPDAPSVVQENLKHIFLLSDTGLFSPLTSFYIHLFIPTV